MRKNTMHFCSNNYRPISRRSTKGFTLIELLVVIAIVGVLAAVVMASLSTSRQKADDSKRMQDMAQLKNAFEIYASKHNGAYPAISTNSLNNNYLALKEKTDGKKTPAFILGLLSFASTPAYAAGNHTNNACLAFDILAAALVADGDLSAVPVDPHDDASVYCYKAWTDGDAVAVWSYSWQKYENTSYGSGATANKHVGFVVSKQSEINREKIIEICEATNSAYSDADTYPVINPYSPSTLCGGLSTLQDGLVADIILGVSTGDETVITGGLLIANGGTCSISADCQSDNCVSTVCQEVAAGVCSNTAYTDQPSCESMGTCGDGSSDISQSSCSGIGGSCSSGGYFDQSSCTAVGYCSYGNYVDESTCYSYNTAGYCSGGGHDESNCTIYGDCTNGSTNVTSGECNTYGTCSSTDMCSDGSTYNNNQDGCITAGCSWTGGTYSWSQYTWQPGTSYSWTVNTWTPTYSWTPYVWTGN